MTSLSNPSFGIATDAADVAAAFPGAIRGRTILITGVNKAGLGYATAKAFASQSPRCLILAGRSAAKVQECIDSLHGEHPSIDIRRLLVDLSSQKSVKTAANEIMSWNDVPDIHLVINNAGIMRHGFTADTVPLSEDGLEDMFATNHIGHFLLTNMIISKVLSAARSTPPASVRIINVSSSGTYVCPLRASDLGWQIPASQLPENEKPDFVMMQQAAMRVDEGMSYIPTAAYCHSKTCNILYSVGLNQRLFNQHSVLSIAINPGEIKTELARNTDPAWLAKAVEIRQKAGLMHWKTPAEGASTTLVAACDPKLSLPAPDGEGQFLSDCQFKKPPVHAVNSDDADKLWRISEDLTGQKFW